jgi:hypothetical protein
MLTLSAGTAGAATLTPPSATFGPQAIGTSSAPRAFTLNPALLDALPLTIATTGDFKQTNNCGALLQFVSGPCTINVTFAPTAAGDRTGTLSSTTLIVGGPAAALRGAATATGNQDGKAGDGRKACKKGKKKRGKKKRAVSSKKKKKKGKRCKKKRGKKKGKGKRKP